MGNTARIVIGVLVVAVLALGTALGVVLARDGDGTTTSGNGSMMGPTTAGYMGMMGAIGAMDSDTMLARMHQVLGDAAYAQMVEHLQQHQAGQGTLGGAGVDGMMHQLMDGMMGQMSRDEGGLLPIPSATSTTTPTTPTP